MSKCDFKDVVSSFKCCKITKFNHSIDVDYDC